MKLSSFALRLGFIIVALNLFVAAMVGLWLQHSLAQNRDDARAAVDNLAQMLQASLTGTIRHIDLTLLTVGDDYRQQSATGRIDDKALNRLLAAQQGHLPEIESLRIADADGNVRYGLGVKPGTNLADREFFIAARDDATPRLIVANPVFARISRKWVVVFARRLETADGSFAGVVYVNLALDKLRRDFEALAIGPAGSASLRDSQLGVIVRVPETLPTEQAIGNRVVSQTLREMVLAGKTAGSYVARTSYDQVERAAAFRRLDPYPLYVTIGFGEEDYLAVWYREALAAVAALALFALVTLSSAWLLIRAWRRQEATAQELAGSELELKAIIDTEPECVKLIDAECRLQRMNAAGLKMIGADSEDQVRGADVTTLIVPAHRDAFRAMTKNVFDGQSGMLEFEMVSLKGNHRWLETHATPLRSPAGEIVSALGVTRDVTQRKRADALVHRLKDELEQRVVERTAQLEAARKELEEFSYSMSHDLRTPLRAINGYSNILLEDHRDELNAEGKRLLGALAENAGRMGRLIDDILRFLGMARRTLKPVQVDLAALAREVFAELEATMPQRRLRLQVDALPPAWGDAEMLKLLLAELFSNAAKFSPPEREAIIELAGEAGDGAKVYRVTDHGVGFDMRYAEKLFKVFERVHPTGSYEGTGIGLAIVKRIVDRHGGRVWAEGSVDGGATFHFSLPDAPAPARGEARPKATETA
jgi:PAS domain S-box-containing protein